MLTEVRTIEAYRNIKTGDVYVVTCIATHSETLEAMVIYSKKDFDGKVWTRPLELFKQKFELA